MTTYHVTTLLEHEGVVYTLSALVHPPIPAVTSGPPDNWAPAEGGEIENVEMLELISLNHSAACRGPGCGHYRIVPPTEYERRGLTYEMLKERIREIAFEKKSQ